MAGNIDRRTILRAGGAALLGAVGLGAAGCGATGNGAGGGGGGTGGGGGGTNVRAAWWGGDSRHAKFNKIYDLYQQNHPEVKIGREFADWVGYWERLPTQYAGGNAPDIVHMTERQVGDYAGRKTLLDLNKLADQGLIDLSKFSEASLKAGTFKDELVMLDVGGTTPACMYNTELFEKAGISAPKADWSWEEFTDLTVQLSKTLPKGVYGAAYSATQSPLFETMLVQDGKTLFAPDAGPDINFEPADAEKWFTLWKELIARGGCQPASVASQDQGVPFEDSAFAKGKTAILVSNHNQLVTYQAALPKTTLDLVPFPQVGAKPAALLIGSYASITAKTKVPEESARIVDFFVNDPAANKIFGMELGTPGNSRWTEAIRDSLSPVEQKVLKHSEAVASIGVPAQPRAAGSALSETLLTELALAVGFDKTTPKEAGKQYADQLSAAVKRG